MNTSKLFKYAVKNVLRNKFLSISTILVLSLMVFFVNVLSVVHNLSFLGIDFVNSRLTISLYLKSDLTDQSLPVVNLMEKLKEVAPDITISYSSKEDALREFIERSQTKFESILGESNPLPATLKLSNIRIEEYEEINKIIGEKIDVLEDKVAPNKDGNYQGQISAIKEITPILKNFQMGIYIVIGVFIFSIGIIIYSVISNFVFFFKDEIYITNLVGGSKGFVYGPFAIQGVIYSLCSLVLGGILFLLVLYNIDYLFINDSIKFVSLIDINFVQLFLIEILGFSILGAFSGYFSSKKYIKTI